jgi:histidinol-phosphate phosphatase family protein
MDKVVFLDRDGTINRDSQDYIKGWDEFEFLPESLAALERLNENGFTVIVITNQSAVPRKLISPEELDYLHTMMGNQIADAGGRIKDIFYCPHLPGEGCGCRKPQPGLIDQARRKYAIDLKSAVMVGDSAKDIECARNAGCGRTVLVRTGNGAEAGCELAAKGITPDFTAGHLAEAVDWIVKGTF